MRLLAVAFEGTHKGAHRRAKLSHRLAHVPDLSVHLALGQPHGHDASADFAGSVFASEASLIAQDCPRKNVRRDRVEEHAAILPEWDLWVA